MSRMRTGLPGNRDFLYLWTAKSVSDFGSMVSRTALSFTAILLLHATPAQLSLLMAADLLPRIFVGLAAGIWVDRVRRRPLMIFADVGRAALLVIIPASALLHRLRIEQMYLVTLGTGMLSLLYDIADRSYLPSLVATEDLVEANSRLTATSSVAEFSAFSLGGWLVQWLTGPIAVLVDAISFLGSALFLCLIRKPEPPPSAHQVRVGIRTELFVGISTVRVHPLLSAFACSTILRGLSHGIFGTVVVAFMARDLGFKPGLLGMIWSIGGLASLAGAMAAGPLARRFGTGPVIIAGLFVASLGGLATPLAHGATLGAALLLVATQLITDPAFTVFDINQTSLRQAITPERLRGRVNATLEFVGLVATLAGAGLGGLLGQWIGLRFALCAGIAASACAAAALLFSPVRHVRGFPETPPLFDGIE